MEVNLRNAELRINTPLGVDVFWINLNKELYGEFDSGIDKYSIGPDNCIVENEMLMINLRVNAPIKENILIKFDSTQSSGKIHIGNYLPVEFVVFEN